MDNFMAQIKSLAQSLYPCSAQRLDEEMKLHLLQNQSVTCNDGSPAGYYLKESKGSRRWLVFLEGPVFVVQWLCDEAQLTVDNVHLNGLPVQESQWLYIQNLGRELRNTLKDVGASFAPACLSHEIITRSTENRAPPPCYEPRR